MQAEEQLQKTTTFAGFPLLISQHISTLVTQILNHNKINGFTSVVLAGASGSGKSTLATTIAHRIHERERYAVRSFQQDEIQQFDTLLKGLPKQPHLLIFDDVSFSLEQLPQAKIYQLAQALTYVRHTLHSNVIIVLCVHYSKTLTPFFRDSAFRVLTSLSSEERQNYIKLFGNKFKLKLFENKYRSMLVRGSFSIEFELEGEQQYIYKTNSPFRIALSSVVGALRFLLYPKESCAICSDEVKEGLPSITSRDFVNEVRKKYGLRKANTVLKWFSFLRGIDALDKDSHGCWNFLAKSSHQFNLNLEEINGILKEDAAVGHKLRAQHAIETIHSRASALQDVDNSNGNSELVDEDASITAEIVSDSQDIKQAQDH